MQAFSAPATPTAPAAHDGDVKRDRYGRYLLPDPDTGVEKAWTRATTISGTLDDTYNLQLWKMRMVARGMGLRPPLAAGAAAVADPQSEDGKRTLNRIADDALTAAGGTDGRELGTALHGFTEIADRTHGVTDWNNLVPETFHADVRAYEEALDAHGLEVAQIERIVICPSLGAAGTLDRIVRCPDGKLRILDLKTEKDPTMGWMKIATQLAIYAHATHILVDGTWRPMFPVDRETALVAHLRPGSGKCDIYEITELKRGWGMAMAAVSVREERKAARNWGRLLGAPAPRSALGIAVEEELGVPLEELDPLKTAIMSARTRERLNALWAANQDVWTDELTALGLEVLARAEQAS